ncbi:MAG: ankyrin repeat domain-containing protein [Candidatus Babeliales bacterium]
MHKCFYSLFLVSSFVVAMEPNLTIQCDPALIPTYHECAQELQNNSWHKAVDTALLSAYAEHGDLHMFESRIGREKKLRDNQLLSWAMGSEFDVVRTLLRRGIAQTIGDSSWCSYIESALSDNNDLLATELLQAKADFDPQAGKMDWVTLLQWAASTGAINTARTLLEGPYGAKMVDASTKSAPFTPLQLAAQWQQVSNGVCYAEPLFSARKREMINLLLTHRAKFDVIITTRFGDRCVVGNEHTQSFVNWCVSQKYDDCLARLVERKQLCGDNVIKNDYSGVEQTLSSWAAGQGSLPLVKALVPMVDEKPKYQVDFTELIKRAVNWGRKPVIDYLGMHPATKRRKSTAQLMMHCAVSHGWLGTARALATHYGIENLTGEDDWYHTSEYFHDIAPNVSPAMVRQLLAWDCNPRAKNEQGNVPLMSVTAANNVQSTAVMLAAGCLLDEGNISALAATFSSNKTTPELFEQLLAYTSDRAHVREICVAQTGMTPVEFAVGKGYRMTKLVLEAGFDPNEYKQEHPLAFAVGHKDSELVALLLRHGADADITFEDGSTLLHRAAQHGSVVMLQHLFNAGVQPSVDENGHTPLLNAAYFNTPEVVSFLLNRNGPEAIRQIAYTLESHNDGPDISQTLFEYVIHQRRNDVVPVCQLLYELGADLERVNELGETPIFWAVRNSNAAALEWAVAQGARLDVTNQEGETPLSFLASQIEWVQEELLIAVLKGLSAYAGGVVPVMDAIELSKKYPLDNYWVSDEHVKVWKASLKFDPFEQIGLYCGTGLHKEYLREREVKPTLAARLKEIEQKNCRHGAYLFAQKMKEMFTGNDLEAVKQFVATNVNLCTYDVQHGATVLHWAAQNGHADLVRDLLENHGLKEVINKETIHKCAALSEAATAECAQILLDNGAAITPNVISRLIFQTNNEACGVILAHLDGAAFSQEDVQRLYESAAHNGNVLITQKFLELGAQPKIADLEHAVREQRVGVATLLAARGISIADANTAAQQNKWNPLSSLAYLAVEKKNSALLKEVIETADESLLTSAVWRDFHEGVAILLEAGIVPTNTHPSDPLMDAIRAKSVECCKLLVEHQTVRFVHVEKALLHAPIMRILLPKFEPSQEQCAALLEKAVDSCAADSVRILLEKTRNLSGVTSKGLTYFHMIAQKAHHFGVDERSAQNKGAHWSERVKNITWLQSWKTRVLEGNECADTQSESRGKVQGIVATLHALMTTPVCASAQTHKNALFWALHGGVGKQQIKPFDMAQKAGNSTTFSDLFDVAKVEQWHAAIDREYEKKDV